jgi:hypothetical protein
MPTKDQLLFKHAYKVTTVARVIRMSADIFSYGAGFAASVRAISLIDAEDSPNQSRLRQKPESWRDAQEESTSKARKHHFRKTYLTKTTSKPWRE